MLEKINSLLKRKFDSLEAFLDFYRDVLPKRVGSYRLVEVGPIMSQGTPEEIEGYLKNRFSFNGIEMDMPNGIDWYGTPTGDLEWNGGFVRHGYFMYLADEYEKTGDEIYPRTIITHMLDYIRNVPPFDPTGKPYFEYKKSTWRPFEAAGRVSENWPVALAKIIGSKEMTPAIWGEIFLSIYTHGEFLSRHHWRTGNHACLECADLAIMSLFYSELAESEKWIAYAVDFLVGIWDKIFYPDGYSREMSGAYHFVAARNFLGLYEVAKNCGRLDIFPEIYVQRLKGAANAEFYQQKPDYSLPITNDSNVTTTHKYLLKKITDLVEDKAYIDYRLSNCATGKKPPHDSYFFKDARLCVMRSGWDSDALYLSFDMGDWGDNHMNEDQLNVELSAFGRNFLINCGRWRYTTSPNVEWLDKAKYFKATGSYNSVIVNGFPQMPDDAEGVFKTYTSNGNTIEHAHGCFTHGYGSEATESDEEMLKAKGVANKKILRFKARHEREVIFVKPYFYIVRDNIIADEPGDTEFFAEQLWHFMPVGLSVIDGGQYVFTNYSDANLIMATINDADNSGTLSTFEGCENPFRGWYCPSYDNLVPAPEAAFKKYGKQQVTFETLLLPIKGVVNTMPIFKKTNDGYYVSHEGKEWNITLE